MDKIFSAFSQCGSVVLYILYTAKKAEKIMSLLKKLFFILNLSKNSEKKLREISDFFIEM